MKQAIEFEDVQVEDAPVSPFLKVQRSSRYGSVPGLDDDELADPFELERQVMEQEFAPVLGLGSKGRSSGIRPDVDESGGLDWGAFGTVDFERQMPEFNKARYKAEKLREERGDVMLLFGIVSQRLPGRAKFLVFRYLKAGIIELEHLASQDMRALGRLYLRARRLGQEIAQLEEASWRRQRAASLG